jgi:toxin HigB-1
VIKRFRHKALEGLLRGGSSKGLDARLVGKLRRMLTRLDDGPLPDAMNLPNYRLHQLKGDRAGMWSVWVTGNYRLIFEIERRDAVNVDLVDYH